jgi:lipoate-protein ligase B
VNRGISYHGFAINLNNSLSPFHLINPCRLESDTMTSAMEILGRPVNEDRAAELVGNSLINFFGRSPSPRGRR